MFLKNNVIFFVFFFKSVDSINLCSIIRLILKSGDQLFEWFNVYNNGDLIWLV